MIRNMSLKVIDIVYVTSGVMNIVSVVPDSIAPVLEIGSDP